MKTIHKILAVILVSCFSGMAMAQVPGISPDNSNSDNGKASNINYQTKTTHYANSDAPTGAVHNGEYIVDTPIVSGSYTTMSSNAQGKVLRTKGAVSAPVASTVAVANNGGSAVNGVAGTNNGNSTGTPGVSGTDVASGSSTPVAVSRDTGSMAASGNGDMPCPCNNSGKWGLLGLLGLLGLGGLLKRDKGNTNRPS